MFRHNASFGVEHFVERCLRLQVSFCQVELASVSPWAYLFPDEPVALSGNRVRVATLSCRRRIPWEGEEVSVIEPA